MGDGEFDRSERAGREDRAGDDDSGARLLDDNEIAADAEHRRLQHHAQHFGNGAETAGDIGGAPLGGHVAFIGLRPARGKAPAHAHGLQYLGVAAAGLGECVALGD
ncbi:hypothetical protein V1293_003833 [Bradyrhizobium sp. AZCC 1693]